MLSEVFADILCAESLVPAINIGFMCGWQVDSWMLAISTPTS
jgi:hypothetical protein